MRRVMILSAALLLALLSSPAVDASGNKVSGRGASLDECMAKSNQSPDEIQGLSCTGLKSLDGIEEFPQLESLALAKGVKEAGDFTLSAADAAVAERVTQLLLVGNGWNEEDIAVLGRVLPAVRSFQCRLCDVHKLGALATFQELSVVHLDLLTVIEAHWYYGKEPDPEITFKGLPYDQVRRISIETSPKTNISCRALGTWQTKASTYFAGNRNYPRPYKDMAACFPRVNELRGSARMIVNIAGNSPEEFSAIAAGQWGSVPSFHTTLVLTIALSSRVFSLRYSIL